MPIDLERLGSLSPAFKRLSEQKTVSAAVERTQKKRQKKREAKTVQDLAEQTSGAMTETLMRTNPFIGPLYQVMDIGTKGAPEMPVETLKQDLPVLPVVTPDNEFVTSQDIEQSTPLPQVKQEDLYKYEPPFNFVNLPEIKMPDLKMPDIAGGLKDIAIIGIIAIVGVMLLGKVLK